MLTKISHYLVLPSEVTDFERSYVQRMNRVAHWFFVAHLPVFVAVAYFNDTEPLLAVALTLAALIGPFVAQHTFSEPRTVSIVHGFTAMIMGGLLVHFGQGPVQIEMHFYFFALLAMLALFGNPMVIVTAAATVAVHHLTLWIMLPQSAFNYDAPVWVVGVHALFVVIESVATCFIARSFFDNVIGLERIVQARTRELDRRNDDMRLVLDNVAQGFITIDRDGVMSAERSAIVTHWFGEATPHTRFADYLERQSPAAACSFRMGWEQVVDGFMPLELTLDQLVKRTTVGDRQLAFEYLPIGGSGDDDFDQLLIVVSDVTSEVERARLRAKQREVVRIFERVIRDRHGFVEFYEEANELVEQITSGTVSNVVTLRRMVHTLKGNAMIFGIDTVATLCHEIEDGIIESGSQPHDDALRRLSERWTELRADLSILLDDRTTRAIEISDDELEGVLRDVLGGEPRLCLARRIADWKLEPTKRRLSRVSEQAKRIARNLNKGEIELDVEDNDLRLEPRRWAPFWSSFVHVVRNAVDHGLEPVDEREQQGKDATGSIRLVTRLEPGQFVVEIIDDGRGIDWERIADKARLAGLPADDHAAVEEALFCDGISTAEDVTEYSGRGVGMAALRSACTLRGGQIHVHSERGTGTRVEFRFPDHEMAGDLISSYMAA